MVGGLEEIGRFVRRRLVEESLLGLRLLLEDLLLDDLRREDRDAIGAEELGGLGQGRVVCDGLGACEGGQLTGVPRRDFVDGLPVLRREGLAGLDLDGHLAALGGVRGHEALAVAIACGLRRLLVLRLERVQDRHGLAAVLRLGLETCLDRGLGDEGVQVAGNGGGLGRDHGVAPVGAALWWGEAARLVIPGTWPLRRSARVAVVPDDSVSLRRPTA